MFFFLIHGLVFSIQFWLVSLMKLSSMFLLLLYFAFPLGLLFIDGYVLTGVYRQWKTCSPHHLLKMHIYSILYQWVFRIFRIFFFSLCYEECLTCWRKLYNTVRLFLKCSDHPYIEVECRSKRYCVTDKWWYEEVKMRCVSLKPSSIWEDNQ